MPYDILGANIPFAIGEVQTSKRGQKFAPITVDGQAWSGWDDFKQAVTLASEAEIRGF